MERVGARPGYFFPESYFFDLLKSTAFNARVLLAVHQESQKIIAGAMFISTKDIVQYHLAGSDTDNMDFYPIKLLIDEMRILATKEGAKYLNLGGGVGNKMDSLFHFKGSFSDVFKDFKVWNYIVNDNVYDEMVQQKQQRKCAKLHRECTDFFPCYRCPPPNGQMERETQLVLSKK
jgi:lipid II:glycine glycyltransferase (peptidoglycan interpeptide bridge formation enzyme)